MVHGERDHPSYCRSTLPWTDGTRCAHRRTRDHRATDFLSFAKYLPRRGSAKPATDSATGIALSQAKQKCRRQ
jgi:hypothetical protein